MFSTFRAGGLATAPFVLAAAIIGSAPCQAQVIPQTTKLALLTTDAPSSVASITEPLQIVPSVQIAPIAMTVANNSIIAGATTEAAAHAKIASAPAPVAAPILSAPTLASRIITPIVKAVRAVGTKGRASLAQLVATHRSSAIPNRERECLAGAIYFESKGEPLSGQVAVGQVIANRAKSGRFPASYCGVVFQRSQFSFIRGRAMPSIPRASAHWKTAVAVAHIVANGLHDAVAPRSLFFHARYVSPNWKRMSRVATVGNHIFYR